MKNNISHMLEKSGLTGLVTMGVGCGFFGCGESRWMIPGTSTTVPLEVLTFTVGVANSFVADGIHMFLNKAIPLGKKTADKTALITNAVIAGVSFFGLLHLTGYEVPYQFTPIRAFVTGALGEVGGTAGYEYLLNNMYI